MIIVFDNYANITVPVITVDLVSLIKYFTIVISEIMI